MLLLYAVLFLKNNVLEGCRIESQHVLFFIYLMILRICKYNKSKDLIHKSSDDEMKQCLSSTLPQPTNLLQYCSRAGIDQASDISIFNMQIEIIPGQYQTFGSLPL